MDDSSDDCKRTWEEKTARYLEYGRRLRRGCEEISELWKAAEKNLVPEMQHEVLVWLVKTIFPEPIELLEEGGGEESAYPETGRNIQITISAAVQRLHEYCTDIKLVTPACRFDYQTLRDEDLIRYNASGQPSTAELYHRGIVFIPHLGYELIASESTNEDIGRMLADAFVKSATSPILKPSFVTRALWFRTSRPFSIT